MTRPVSAIVLAAGASAQMQSERPKPLHFLCGRPMLRYVIDALSGCEVNRVVVVVGGEDAEQVTKRFHDDGIELTTTFVEQSRPKGTGDAASVGLTGLPDSAFGDEAEDGDVIVAPADAPLLRAETVASLVQRHRDTDAACTLLTATVDDPAGLARVVRAPDGAVRRVVSDAEADPTESELTEVHTSVYCFRRSLLAPALRRLSPDGLAGEYHLRDVVEVLHEAGYCVEAVVAEDALETSGVNDRAQLARAEAELRRRTTAHWLAAGVTMVDPERTYIDATVELGTDVTLFPGTMLQGATVVGSGAQIGPDTRLVDCMIGAGAVVEQTAGRDAEVGPEAVVGPFVVLEPGAAVAADQRAGPFYTATNPDDAEG